MVFGFFKAHERARRPAPPVRPRLALGDVPLVYAIGDVHGHLDLLVELEAQIAADRARLQRPALLVMLGDYVDRGPDSRGVIAHLLEAPPAGFRRHCIIGNHEAAMLDFLAEPLVDEDWLGFGGLETLSSYGLGRAELEMLIRSPEQARALLAAAIPPQHVAFLSGLPVLVETDRAVFVHAGLRPGLPLAAQTDEDLIWIRDGYRQSYAEFGKCVVHGHTPRELPLVTEFRIAIDTGAFQTGRLTAVRLMEGREPRLFST